MGGARRERLHLSGSDWLRHCTFPAPSTTTWAPAAPRRGRKEAVKLVLVTDVLLSRRVAVPCWLGVGSGGKSCPPLFWGPLNWAPASVLVALWDDFFRRNERSRALRQKGTENVGYA